MADDHLVDKDRRRFLLASSGVVGSAGAATAAWPFIASMNPSAHAHAVGAPIEVDLNKIEPGQMVRDQWRGKPVWIVRRSKEMLKTLDQDGGNLRDPDSLQSQQPPVSKNKYRSIKPEYLVLVGVCTHLGCSPTFRPDVAPEDLGARWKGGFFCACHGSRFDLAGRVYKNVPAPKNLEVPPYRFLDDNKIVIGEESDDAEHTA